MNFINILIQGNVNENESSKLEKDLSSFNCEHPELLSVISGNMANLVNECLKFYGKDPLDPFVDDGVEYLGIAGEKCDSLCPYLAEFKYERYCNNPEKISDFIKKYKS